MAPCDMTGIYWDDNRLYYQVQIFYEGRNMHVGYFDTIEQAIVARDRMKRVYGNSRHIPPRPVNSDDIYA